MKGGRKWAVSIAAAARADGMRNTQVIGLALTALLIASCNADKAQSAGPVPPPVVHAMVPTNAMVITNSGSTNMIGYRIIVAANGEASFVSGEGHGSAKLAPTLLAKLKYDVVMAQPLSHVRASKDCMKPASFASATYIALADERSEDLTCPASPKGEALQSDVEAVVDFLHVRNVPRGQGQELPPQNF
jgi:hypothetical protein